MLVGRLRRLGRTADLCAMLVLVALALMGGRTPASAQMTIPVTNTGDPTGAGGCTLRDAIDMAQGGSAAAGDTCISNGSGAPFTIVFGVTGTIMLASELPQITGNLTIIGPSVSPGITIDGGGKVRLIQLGSGATLDLQFLTLAHGHSSDGNGGGAIFNGGGTLTVTNSTFSGNTGLGGAIANGGATSGGTLTVTNSTFSGNSSPGSSGVGGGAIFNVGTLTVINSTFSGNSATNGGGIFNYGSVTVTNSTFSGNSAVFDGGGITEGEGATGPLIVKGSVFANESSGGNCSPGINPISDAGYNISDDGSCGFAKTGSANNGDSVDPKLDTAGLKNNGGPTQTFALQTSSPAIDAIQHASCTDQSSPPNQLTTDQRGMPRPDPEDGPTGPCDIGAYEFQDPAPSPTPSQTATPAPTPTTTRAPTSTSTATPTATVTPTPTATACSAPVAKVTPQVDLTVNGSTSSTVSVGDTVTFMARIHAAACYPSPNGSISISDSTNGAIRYGSAPITKDPKSNDGLATITNSGIAVGSYTLVAAYGGDNEGKFYNGAQSNTVSLAVKPKAGGPEPPPANVTSTSVTNVAAPGATVAAGTLTIQNPSAVTESIASASINVSDPGLFSTMTLSGAGQSVTVTSPSASTRFTFTTPISIPAGGSVTFSASAVIAMHPVMLGGEIKYAGLTPTNSLPITTSTWSLIGGLLMLGVALLGLPGGKRRRVIIIAVLGLGLAAASAGCGGGSSGPIPVSSTQQVTAVAISAGGAPATVKGLPASLGTVVTVL